MSQHFSISTQVFKTIVQLEVPGVVTVTAQEATLLSNLNYAIKRVGKIYQLKLPLRLSPNVRTWQSKN